MDAENKNSDHKSDRDVLADLIKESVGYENGLVKTFRDLKSEPIKVIDGYFQNNKQYVSPFKLFIGILTLWLFVNSFFIDWYSIWAQVIQDISDFSFFASMRDDMDSEKKAAYALHFGKIKTTYTIVFGDLFSKFYLPFAVVHTILSALIIKRLTQKYRVEFRRILVIMTYTASLNSILLFIISLVFAIHLWAAVALIFGILIFSLFGVTIFTISPVRKMFLTDGKKIEHKFMLGNLISTVILFTVWVTGYVIWFYGIN